MAGCAGQELFLDYKYMYNNYNAHIFVANFYANIQLLLIQLFLNNHTKIKFLKTSDGISRGLFKYDITPSGGGGRKKM